MRALTSPAETGAVTLAPPHDAHPEPYDYPAAVSDTRTRTVATPRAEREAGKQAAVPLVGDAKAVLEELLPMVSGYRVGAEYSETIEASQADWRVEVDRVCAAGLPAGAPEGRRLVTQAQVIGVLQDT